MVNGWGEIPNELQETMYTELLDNPFVGLNLADGSGRVLFVNNTHGRITGQSYKLYIGRTMFQLADHKIVSESATVSVIKSGKSVLINQSVPSGKTFQVKAIPIKDFSGKIIYVINYLIDVSELTDMQGKVMRYELQKKKLLEDFSKLKKVLYDKENIIYQSHAMHRVVSQAKRVAEHDTPVLITGPSGSGKEHIANIIHTSGARHAENFVKINCAAIPRELMESELFGYEPGAFTGGNPKGKIGLIESADKGSILLDEIGEMPLSLQPKLLRVLQDRQVMRIGGRKPIDVDFRIIASTNVNLDELIEQKLFRRDLYYRLNVIEIKVPSLSERREDIPLLTEHFLTMFNLKYNVYKTMDSEAVQYLAARDYPGNIRELKNIIERIVVQSTADQIGVLDVCDSLGLFGLPFGSGDENIVHMDNGANQSLKSMVAEYEKKIIIDSLKKYGSPTITAKMLGIDQSTISRKMIRYKINVRNCI